MTTAPQNIIGLLISPVLMISACGLLCLTYYNRMAVMVARIRAFNSERLNLLEKQIIRQENRTYDNLAISQRARSGAVGHQVETLLYRARLIRRTLVCLVCCIICMLTSSLSLGISLIFAWFAAAALAVFIAGIAFLLVGMIMALQELRLSLTPVALEQDFLCELAHQTEGAMSETQTQESHANSAE